jgi:hypothetical protein
MNSRVKSSLLSLSVVRAAFVIAVLSFIAVPLSAAEIIVKSDATNLGAMVASSSDPSLASGDISGLTFSPVGTDNEGTFTPVPSGAPLRTIVVQVPPRVWLLLWK